MTELFGFTNTLVWFVSPRAPRDIRRRCDDQEFVAGQSRDRVAGPHTRLEPIRCREQQFVADCMLEALGVHSVEQKQILRHVVLFKFKEDVTADQVGEVTLEFAKLPSKIDAIVDFEWGTDVSVEGKAKGFTHAFVVGFRNDAGRDEYLPHPAHEEFVKLVGPLLDDVLVFDFHVGR